MIELVSFISGFCLLLLCPRVNSQSLINVIKALANSHDFEGLSRDGGLRDEEYASCMQLQPGAQQSEPILGPFYRFTVEKNVVRLPCSPCYYSSRPFPVWYKLTFDNQRIQIGAGADTDTVGADGKYQIENDDSLVINPVASVSDFATFYCEVNGYVGNIWTLEPEAYAHLTLVASKKWETDADARVDRFSARGAVVSVSIEWEPWEPCNKCDFVGKQHRIGHCKVQGENPNLESGLELPPVAYEPLVLYPSGVSCTLFSLFHGISPTAGQSQPHLQNLALERSLMRGPFVMLNFCRVPCANFDFDPRTRFESLDPALRAFYKQDLRELGEEQALADEFNEHFPEHEGLRLRVRGISLASFIPTRLPTGFEWFLLAVLAGLQIYILAHVCRNRYKAN